MTVPSSKTRPSGVVKCRALVSTIERIGATHTGLAHAAGDDGSVRGLAAAAGQDAFGGDHAVEVVGVGLASDQDDLLTRVRPLHGGVGVEDDLADGRTGRGVHALGQELAGGVVLEGGEHQLCQLGAGDALQGLGLVDQALVDELGRDPEGRPRGPLADPGLQHPQLAALDRELDVAQVAVVLLELAHDRHQLVVRLLVQALEVGQGQRVADPGDDILTLGVLQVVAVDALGPRGRVARERHPRARVRGHVAEHHRADVDRGAQVGGDALLAAIQDRAIGVPRVEDGPDGKVHLLARLLRELPARVLVHDRLVRLDQRPQVVGVQVEVVLRALGLLGGVQRALEELALDVENGLAEHLDQPAVGVEREPLVAGLLRQPQDRLVVEPDVQDGVHHPGHRELPTGAHRHQQRVVDLAQRLAHRLLERGEVLADLGLQRGRLGAVGEIGLARLGRDDEPRRHRQPHPRHLRQVCPLASEQILEVFVAFGEVVHELGHSRTSGAMMRAGVRRLALLGGMPETSPSRSHPHGAPFRGGAKWPAKPLGLPGRT